MLAKWGIANPHEAVMMAELNPAKWSILMMFVVQIREGYDADFIMPTKFGSGLRPISMGSNVAGDELDSESKIEYFLSRYLEKFCYNGSAICGCCLFSMGIEM